MRALFGAAVAACLADLPAAPAGAEGLRVVVSIKPLHSLVAGVMAGRGAPTLLLAGAASPHLFSLRPSQALALAEAQAAFLVARSMESFLVKPLRSLAGEGRVVEVAELPGLRLLATRAGGAWSESQEASVPEDHAQDGHGAPVEGALDPHLWLDPDNAIAIVEGVAATLSALDPAGRGVYAENARALTARFEALDRELAERLAPVREQPYIVFHDAFQYFERHYRLNAQGAVVVSPERPPSARRIQRIRALLEHRGVVCAFAEPQFRPAVLRSVLEGSSVRLGVLDPLGAELPAGPEAYPTLMRALAEALRACLAPAG